MLFELIWVVSRLETLVHSAHLYIASLNVLHLLDGYLTYVDFVYRSLVFVVVADTFVHDDVMVAEKLLRLLDLDN